MRPIKFRAWDRQAGRMRTVDDLENLWTLCNHEGAAKTIPNVIVINQSYRGNDLELIVDKHCDLMQYTGLKDKNGKEIFERDIVKFYFPTSEHGDSHTELTQVIFEKGAFEFKIKELRYCCYDKEISEIIGNVWENPELIK